MNTGKGLGEHERTQSLKNHPPLARYIEAEDWSAGVPRQVNRPRLCDISWSARPVDGKGHKFPAFQFALQLAEGLDGSSRAGSSNGAKTKSLDDACDVLSIVAAAGEYPDSMIPEHICSRKHTPVPEAVDCRTRSWLVLGARFIRE